MMDELAAYFSDPKKCIKSINTARKAFGNRNTTREQYEQMEKTLGIMYLYCPEELDSIVYATIHEAQIRRAWFEVNIWEPVEEN